MGTGVGAISVCGGRHWGSCGSIGELIGDRGAGLKLSCSREEPGGENGVKGPVGSRWWC